MTSTLMTHHASTNRRTEILADLDRFVGSHPGLALPVDKCWQPSDLLPDFSSSTWNDQLNDWRLLAQGVPDDVLVTLVANMITEEALPSYHAWLSNLEHGYDRTGCGDTGMAQWFRAWVSEEKRHGDALARYLYLTGRVNMRAVEQTIQHLLRNGFDPGTENNIYQAFIYTSFQERATYVAHSHTARKARAAGDPNLAKICDMIAGDEVRHERAYEKMVAHLFELDPDGCMMALERMLRKSITMPSRLMTDGMDGDLFSLFSSITQRNGIYTTMDYAEILEHLIRLWRIDTIDVQGDAAKSAQEYLVNLPARYHRAAVRAESRLAKVPSRPISWIYGRMV